MTGRVNTLYNAGGANSKKRRNSRAQNKKVPSGSREPGNINTDITISTMREWTASISVSKFDLNGQRFIIRIFRGQVPDDPTTWKTSPNLAGSLVILPPLGVPVSDRNETRAHDEVVLMREDVVGGAHQDMDMDGDGEGTVEYLKGNLHWRVQLVSYGSNSGFSWRWDEIGWDGMLIFGV